MKSASRLSLIVHVSEWLRNAITPLEWCHVYAPVVALSTAIELLDCPAPFLVGMVTAASVDAAELSRGADAIIADLDEDAVEAPPRLTRVAARSSLFQRSLEGFRDHLQSHAVHCDDAATGELPHRLLRLRCSASCDALMKTARAVTVESSDCNTTPMQHANLVVASLVQDLHKFAVSFDVAQSESVLLLDEEWFVRDAMRRCRCRCRDSLRRSGEFEPAREENDREFLTIFLRTQCVSHLLVSTAAP